MARIMKAIGILFLGLLLQGGLPAMAQEEEAAPRDAGLSRQMRMGIYFFEKGDDMQAMDRFMDVLTNGAPAERSLANEYINLLNRRMNTLEKTPLRPSALKPHAATIESVEPEKKAAEVAPAPPQAPVQVLVEPGEEVAAAPVSESPKPAPRPLYETRQPPAEKSAMKQEIRAQLQALKESALRKLKAWEQTRVILLENGDPQALAIPSALLFQPGVVFQRQARGVLDALTQLTYALGSAQISILPEGTAVGDAKVLDMRRSMGISAHLYSAGIAPARVKVNLLNGQVEIPKALRSYKGIILLFEYGKPLKLDMDGALGEEAGPAISLGVYPRAVRAASAEGGAIIEFSVQDPPSGLASWKFQLLRPASSDGKDLAPLQELSGTSPIFHQIYWNGSINYSGPPLPAGRYECVLTATDSRNRQKTLHRWIQISGASAGPAQAKPGGGAPSPEMPRSPSSSAKSLIKDSLIKETQTRPRAGLSKVEISPRRKKGLKAKTRQKPVKKPTVKAPAPTDYEIIFLPDGYKTAGNSGPILSQIAERSVYYPQETLQVTGYARSSEPDASVLAEKRAQMLAGLLINKYQVESKKIKVSSSVSDAAEPKAAVNFVRGE
ncbi:MAG: hypothetical protein HY921_01145 [Elusimicrobia bacterium]|nr:hypothetical protein [Elusimicrobiota bacterium]